VRGGSGACLCGDRLGGGRRRCGRGRTLARRIATKLNRAPIRDLLAPVPDRPHTVGRTTGRDRVLARRCGSYILEDDSDGELRFEGSPMKAIAANAPHCTMYLVAFSRPLGAGFRLGFLVVPPTSGAEHYITSRAVGTSGAEALTAAKRLFEGGGSWLEQAARRDDAGFELFSPCNASERAVSKTGTS
jgi:hypothetical protein